MEADQMRRLQVGSNKDLARQQQHRMVARVMVDMRNGRAILLGLETQDIVVVMALPALMDRRVLDLLHQNINDTARHESHRRLQLQQEQ